MSHHEEDRQTSDGQNKKKKHGLISAIFKLLTLGGLLLVLFKALSKGSKSSVSKTDKSDK